MISTPARVAIPAQRAEQHRGVVHAAFAEALVVVHRQHRAEGLPVAALPQLDHLAVGLFQERVEDLVHELRRAAVLREAVAQRATGEDRHRAVVAVFDGLAHGASEARALGQVVPHAPARHPDDLEVLVGIHVAHRHQRAVLELQRGRAVRAGLDAALVGDVGDQVAERRVAGVLVGQVADEVRQLVAGVHALEVRRAVQVVLAVDEPVHVEHHDGVHTQRAAAAADLDVAVDGGLAAALVRAVELAQVHRRHVGDLGGEGEASHVGSRFRPGATAARRRRPTSAPAACCWQRTPRIGA